MARTKKHYMNGKAKTGPEAVSKTRGGVHGKAVDSGFGAPGNLHKSKRTFRTPKEMVGS